MQLKYRDTFNLFYDSVTNLLTRGPTTYTASNKNFNYTKLQ